MGDLGVLAQMFTYRAHAILSFSIAQIRGQVPVPSLIQRAFHRGRDTPSFVLFFFSARRVRRWWTVARRLCRLNVAKKNHQHGTVPD